MMQYGKLKEWDSLFPAVEVDREPPNVSKFREELWRQLDHLGYQKINFTSSLVHLISAT
jgi:hypothetical protein